MDGAELRITDDVAQMREVFAEDRASRWKYIVSMFGSTLATNSPPIVLQRMNGPGGSHR